MLATIICLVVAISDGDTLTARCGEPGAYQQLKIRLLEIDAPEKKQPYGQRSKQSLSALCYGQQVIINTAKKDRYGRSLSRVQCQGLDASTEQVRQGLAWAYTRYLTDPNIAQLESEARAAKRGLWADSNPVPPWQWRKR